MSCFTSRKRMLRYFPFEESFDPGMGMRVLNAEESLCDVDPTRYHQEISLKRGLLTEAHSYYFHGGPETLTAQWDVVDLVATDLARSYPQHFQLQRDGDDWRWRNELTGQTAS